LPAKSRSAWTARARGATMSSSSASGNQSSMRKSTCTPTTASAQRAPPLADIWISIIDGVRIRALTDARPMRPTLTRRPSRRPHEIFPPPMFGRNYGRASPFLRRKRTSAIPNQQPPAESTYHSREAVQTTSASSVFRQIEPNGRDRRQISARLFHERRSFKRLL
jgi:hypothetical protein